MNESRRDRIIDYLRIKPISHGQVYTFQIAIPKSQVGEISPQRWEKLNRSLVEQGSNLIPLIVRRTEAYSEEEEYELVYGADWYLVAKELDIEKMWVWVFDMTDEQAAVAKAEMEQLASSTGVIESSVETDVHTTADSSEHIDLQHLPEQLEELFDGKLEITTKKINQCVSDSIKGIIDNLSGQLEAIRSEIESLKGQTKAPKQKNKNEEHPSLNLSATSEQEIASALNNKQLASAAWKAIKYWQTTGKELTWENLERSTKRGKPESIAGFGLKTYQKLKEVGHIGDK